MTRQLHHSGPKRPETRNITIFRRALAGVSTREIASEFQLSPSRVRRIVAHVTNWLAEAPRTLRASDLIPELPTDKTELLIANLKLDQLQLGIEQLWREWDRSRRPIKTTKVTEVEGKDARKLEKTSRSQRGDPRYIDLIRRLLVEIERTRQQASKQLRKKEKTNDDTLSLEQRRLAVDRILEIARQRSAASRAGGDTDG